MTEYISVQISTSFIGAQAAKVDIQFSQECMEAQFHLCQPQQGRDILCKGGTALLLQVVEHKPQLQMRQQVLTQCMLVGHQLSQLSH